jgi:Core-2/I-Branching enzyme
MTIAYLIIGHRYPRHIIDLIGSLRDSKSFFVVHIDKRASDSVYAPLREYAAYNPNVFLTKRVRCYWGGFGIVKATIECVKTVVELNRDFDYAVLLSGQDYPIKSTGQIAEFLQKNKRKEFIESFALSKPNRWSDHGGCYQAMNRVQYWTCYIRSRVVHVPIRRKFPFGWEPHGGSQWWGLSKEGILHIEAFIRANPGFVRFFEHAFIPDECLVHTILSNSAFRDRIVGDHLHYIDTEHPNPDSPRTLEASDFESLRQSPKLFARKFDPERSRECLDLIDAELLGKRSGEGSGIPPSSDPVDSGARRDGAARRDKPTGLLTDPISV